MKLDHGARGPAISARMQAGTANEAIGLLDYSDGANTGYCNCET